MTIFIGKMPYNKGMQTSQWKPIVDELHLLKQEKEVAESFFSNGQHKRFLAVAEILLKYRKNKEAVELLIQGVEFFPTLNVARILLVKELYDSGLIDQAWYYLSHVTSSIQNNHLAMRLKFSMQIIAEDISAARQTARQMIHRRLMSPKVQEIYDLLEISGINIAKRKLLEPFTSKDMEIVFDSYSESSLDADQDSLGLDLPIDEDSIEDVHTENVRASQKFYVMRLSEVFSPSDHLTSADKISDHRPHLDSETLADIYGGQGFYQKALNIYRSLLLQSPHNDLLKRKISKMSRALKEQREIDYEVDPEMVDRLEALEIIDTHRQFYGETLEILNSRRDSIESTYFKRSESKPVR